MNRGVIKTIWFALALGCGAMPACVLAAGGSGTTVTATATATMVRPLSVVKTDDLDFARLIASGAAGTATINATDNGRTTGGGVVAAGGTPMAAHFTAAGTVNVIALVALPASIVVTRGGGAETMTVTSMSSNGATLRLFPSSGTIDLAVGGTLNVSANQVAGDYSGTFIVNVLYF